MAPPIIVTEDTPPDMLAGSMDLTVVLPDNQCLKMSVERSTPMMDLLVQVTTANKLSPAGFIIKPLGERGPLPYKPSTPIGALDTWTIHVVPKQHAQCASIKRPLKSINQPFEQTFRLQVHLPRNQLYVARVSPKTRLADIILQVCSEKNLDPLKYSLRHPNNLDQVLNLSCTLGDYKLQELTLVCNRTHPVEVSTVDIMSLQREPSNPAYRNNMREGSVSSGSLEGRSLSPVPSDESSASPPPLPPSRPTRKRRPAPKPPILNQKTINEEKELNGVQSLTLMNHNHSRNSSDSSGYHEASVLSESPKSNSVSEHVVRRKMASVSEDPPPPGPPATCPKPALSQSMTDVSQIQPPLKQSTSYNSITSLSSITGRKKKSAPPPPPTAAVKNRPSSMIEDQGRTPSVSSTASSTTTLDGNDMNVAMKSSTLPPSSRLNTVSPSPHPAKVDVVPLPPSTPQGRFAASACRLIYQTKRKVGRNLNKFGNSFKFKKSNDKLSTAKEEEINEGKDCKFKKLVRKNAIKKNNLDSLKQCVERSIELNQSKPISSNVASCPKKVNSINVSSNSGRFIYESIDHTRKSNHKLDFLDKFKTLGNKNEIATVGKNLSSNNKEDTDKPNNLVKFDDFFRCIEIDNINNMNRNIVGKSTSFSDKSNVSKHIPLKSNSFRVLTEYNSKNLSTWDNTNAFEQFRFKLNSFENSQGNFNNMKMQNETSNFSLTSSLPLRCNLLEPPPAGLLINRHESLESWNKFLHHLDDILMNDKGEFV